MVLAGGLSQTGRQHLYVHVSLGTGREGTEDGFLGEGQEVASPVRAQEKGGDWTGTGCVGREGGGRETPEPWGAGRAVGLGSRSARSLHFFFFLALVAIFQVRTFY